MTDDALTSGFAGGGAQVIWVRKIYLILESETLLKNITITVFLTVFFFFFLTCSSSVPLTLIVCDVVQIKLLPSFPQASVTLCLILMEANEL